MDELFEVLTLVQTHKIDPFPVILVNRKFWQGALDWIENTILGERKYIDNDDTKIFHVADKPEEVIQAITKYYRYKKLL